MDAWVWISVATAALIGGTVLSTLAQSLRDLARGVIEEIAAIRNRPAGRVRVNKILDDVEGHAAASALPRIACNLIFVVAMVQWIVALRGVASPGWVEALIAVVASSVVLWIFGFLLPAAIAKHAAEITVFAWSPLIRFNYLLAKPITAVAHVTDEAVRRLAGKPVDQGEALQEELLSVVDEAQEEGAFDDTERAMIEAVVKFGTKTVAQVMTPRTEMEAMPLTNDLSQVTAFIRKVGHSRIPVYDNSLDHIVGIFYVKDLMRWLAGESSRGGKTFDFKRLLRPAIFVPETKTIRDLLPELIKSRVHIAMVADEYGGTAGLVTFEDIVEEIFGDIQDEYELPETDLDEIRVDAAAGWAEIDARAYVNDANEALKPLHVQIPESEDYDTVGGFVTVALGRIPAAGEGFAHGEGDAARSPLAPTWTVLAAEPTRVTRVRVSVPRQALTDTVADLDARDDDRPDARSDAKPDSKADSKAGSKPGARVEESAAGR